jgi:hypothetical protein
MLLLGVVVVMVVMEDKGGRKGERKEERREEKRGDRELGDQ